MRGPRQKILKNNELITRQRYLFVISFKCVNRLLWRKTRNVIAGHSWCKGKGPVTRLGDRPLLVPATVPRTRPRRQMLMPAFRVIA